MSGYRYILICASSAVFSSSAFAENLISPSGLRGLNEQTVRSVQPATFRGPIDPLKSAKKSKSETTHMSLVLVGDTGFAPTGTKPHPKGVAKHGVWQTFEQTTSRIRNEINGDINFANMESVVSSSGSLRARPKAFNFVTHPNGVDHLVNIGFNLFSMANNHTFDYGAKGVRHSVEAMNRLRAEKQIEHAGVGLNREEAASTPVITKKGTRFAFGAIGIGASGGGLPRATSKRPGQLNMYNSSDHNLLMDNLAAAYADYRIVSVHRGIERQVRVNRDEIRRARRKTLDQGNVDLLVGHHAHVTRGIELNQGRVIFYGLGNFLHQGTANMAGSGGCRDYSILARVHLVRDGEKKPELAAVEIVPIEATHLRPKPMSPRKGAKRIAILNGLARQFDDPASGAEGMRFAIRDNGTGLYCTAKAQANETTRGLCSAYTPPKERDARVWRAAVSSCGGSYRPTVLTAKKVKSPKKSKKVSKASVAAKEKKLPVTKAVAVKSSSDGFTFAKLSNSALAQMNAKEQKLYWTRYWYFKRGRKIPNHLR